MAGSTSIVDWNSVSLNQGVQLMARALREHLGTRFFIVDVNGEFQDLTPKVSGMDTVFDHFVATDARWDDGGQARASMVATVDQWTQRLRQLHADEPRRDRPTALCETEPGFSAQIVPVADTDAAVVVAGYVPAEKAATRVATIRAVLPDHLRQAIEDGDDGPVIVQLPRDDRRWLGRLAQTMAGAIEDALRKQGPSLVDDEGERFAGMLGKSPGMHRLFRQIEKVAPTASTVLITGENGTGKELVARAIHRLSDRCEEPFLAINCAAIPGDLIASELLGHVKGSFSGAHRDRRGLFEAAHGGTLLLDEIGDMEQSLQTKLLRVLQEGTVVRVGDSEVRKVDVRVLCATNTDLEAMVRRGEFRRDLYFRIRVIELAIPALRQRRGDVELLANYFVGAAARRHGRDRKALSPACLQLLSRYGWPGNVRELENEVERLVIMSGADDIIEADLVSPRIQDSEPQGPTLDFEGYKLPEAIEFIERKMILEGLQRTGWNKTQTAKDLGVSRRNLIRKVARFELEKDANEH